MESNATGKGFKMKGHTLPGINQRSEGNTDLPDGRSASSPFQHKRFSKAPGDKNDHLPGEKKHDDTYEAHNEPRPPKVDEPVEDEETIVDEETEVDEESTIPTTI